MSPHKNPASSNARLSAALPVWLLGTGLAVGIVMVILLLGVILTNGLVVFWPREVTQFTLKEGSDAGPGGRQSFAAIVLDKRLQENHTQEQDTEEYYLFIGNAELLGNPFFFLPEDAVAEASQPQGLMVAERVSRGDAIFKPISLQTADGVVYSVESSDFNRILQGSLSKNRGLRQQMEVLESGEIAELNRRMELLRREAIAGDTSREELARAMETRHEVLVRELRDMREALQETELTYQLVSGEIRTVPLGELLSVHQPNRMSPFEKLGYFATHFWRFLSENPREGNTHGGIFPVIVGTFVLTLLMSVLVMPLGVVAAVYLREYARPGPIVQAVRIAVSNLAGVPSIVYGVFGLGFFVYFLGGTIDSLFFADKLPAPTFGTGGILWAALTLALLTVPVVIVATEESLAAFPGGMREASFACGASRWQTLLRVVLPASAPGMLTGLILAVARAAGEVAPLMLVGVVAFAPDLPFDSVIPWIHLDRKFMHMGYHIYSLGFLTPDSEAAMPMVYATTLLLILIVVVLNVGAILLRDRMRRRYRGETF